MSTLVFGEPAHVGVRWTPDLMRALEDAVETAGGIGNAKAAEVLEVMKNGPHADVVRPVAERAHDPLTQKSVASKLTSLRRGKPRRRPKAESETDTSDEYVSESEADSDVDIRAPPRPRRAAVVKKKQYESAQERAANRAWQDAPPVAAPPQQSDAERMAELRRRALAAAEARAAAAPPTPATFAPALTVEAVRADRIAAEWRA